VCKLVKWTELEIDAHPMTNLYCLISDQLHHRFSQPARIMSPGFLFIGKV
jgi:hypothetical protein